jgi:phosphatidylglycerophosphatase A
MTHLIVTLFGVGHLRPAPGTWGSLAALPLAFVLVILGGGWLLSLGIVVACVAGLCATKAEIAATGDTDPSHVVIDEVAGQWIALLPIGFGVTMTGAAPLALWPGWVAAFLFFRLFDIWKPGPIGRADARGDALGVMADDVLAGIAAAACTFVLGALAHLPLILG